VHQETAETAGGSEEWGKDTDALYTVYDGTQGGIKKYQSVYMSEQEVSLNKFANDVAFPGHSDAAHWAWPMVSLRFS